MKQPDYKKSFTANISPRDAYDYITRVSEWWTDTFKGSAVNVNDTFGVTFGKTNVSFKVTEAVPYKKLVWLVTGCHLDWLQDKAEWKDTKVAWEITENGEGTHVEMTHIGLVPELECYKNCEDGWNEYVGVSLPKLITSGKGNIFKGSNT